MGRIAVGARGHITTTIARWFAWLSEASTRDGRRCAAIPISSKDMRKEAPGRFALARNISEISRRNNEP
jgi:hypothetical protein